MNEPIITNAMLRAQDQERIAELEAENKSFRAAQKACETCDAPTMAKVETLKELLADILLEAESYGSNITLAHGLDERIRAALGEKL